MLNMNWIPLPKCHAYGRGRINNPKFDVDTNLFIRGQTDDGGDLTDQFMDAVMENMKVYHPFPKFDTDMALAFLGV